MQLHHCFSRAAGCASSLFSLVFFEKTSPSHCLALPTALLDLFCDGTTAGGHRWMCTVLPPKAAVRMETRTSGGRRVKKALSAVAWSHISAIVGSPRMRSWDRAISQDFVMRGVA